MEKIKIIADSTCDLTEEYLKDNDISIIPLHVIFGEESYDDGINLDVKGLYDKVDETKTLPKTAACSIAEFKKCFEKYLEEGYDKILFIGISSKFSSTVQNAKIAAEDYDGKIFVHDSYNLSSGIGLQVLKAVKMKNEGLSAADILSNLQKIAPNVRSQFEIETLDYLYKGGRCSSLTYFFGRGLKIKPIIRVIDGGMKVFKMPRGKTINALNTLLEIFKSDITNFQLDLDCVMITHSIADESAKYLYEELSKIIDPKIIMITKAGCVISSHCGRGTIGILYILK